MEKVKRMPVRNIEAALLAYYGSGYLSNQDIRDIFGVKAGSTVAALKKPVLAAEEKENIPIVVPHHVNAKLAFRVWGIDVVELERNRKKLIALFESGNHASKKNETEKKGENE